MGLLPNKTVILLLLAAAFLGYGSYQKNQKERLEAENALLKANIVQLEQTLTGAQNAQTSTAEYGKLVEKELFSAQQTINSLLGKRHDKSSEKQRSMTNEQEKLFHLLNAPL